MGLELWYLLESYPVAGKHANNSNLGKSPTWLQHDPTEQRMKNQDLALACWFCRWQKIQSLSWLLFFAPSCFLAREYKGRLFYPPLISYHTENEVDSFVMHCIWLPSHCMVFIIQLTKEKPFTWLASQKLYISYTAFIPYIDSRDRTCWNSDF